MVTAGEMNQLRVSPEMEAIISFCYPVLDMLDTTKATIGLCENDIIKNCNTSMYNICKFIESKLSILPVHIESCNGLKAYGELLINDIQRFLLSIYGEHFSRWFDYNIAKAEKEDPNFYDDLNCIQKLEKKYKQYNSMRTEFEKCQELCREFRRRMWSYLNPLKSEAKVDASEDV